MSVAVTVYYSIRLYDELQKPIHLIFSNLNGVNGIETFWWTPIVQVVSRNDKLWMIQIQLVIKNHFLTVFCSPVKAYAIQWTTCLERLLSITLPFSCVLGTLHCGRFKQSHNWRRVSSQACAHYNLWGLCHCMI